MNIGVRRRVWEKRYCIHNGWKNIRRVMKEKEGREEGVLGGRIKLFGKRT